MASKRRRLLPTVAPADGELTGVLLRLGRPAGVSAAAALPPLILTLRSLRADEVKPLLYEALWLALLWLRLWE